MRQCEQGSSVRVAGRRGHTYLSALLALGLTAGIAHAQEAGAVDPVNISGEKKAAPAAAVPSVGVPRAAVPTAAPVVAPATAPIVAQPVAPMVAPSTTQVATPAAAPVSPVTAPVAAPTETAVQAVTPTDVSKPDAPAAAPAVATPVVPPAPPAVAPTAPTPTSSVVTDQPVTPAPAVAPIVDAKPPEPVTQVPPAAPEVPTPAAPATPVVSAPVETATASAPADAAEAAASKDGKSYAITSLKIDYYKDSPGQPPISDLMHTPVQLGVVGDAYVAPRAGVQIVTVNLGDIGGKGITKIHRSGIEAIYTDVVRFFNRRGIIGVFVVVDSKDIDATDKDIRPPERKSLQLIVVTSRVKKIRTLATGSGVSDENRVDDPRFNRIKVGSPLKADGNADGRMDLLNKDLLDNYVLRLNRHPGRRVDVAISGTDQPGEVDLDYLVAQSKPWYVYAQVSNTGTEQTNPWRERVGYVNNQLFGNDDIFSIDYLTSSGETHAVVASYELPVSGIDRLRYKVFATYNQFDSSDVGQNFEDFTGEEWTVGNELIYNLYQRRELFVDAIGGFRFESITADNDTTGVHGEADYIVPYVGLRLERSTDIASTTASVTLVSYITCADTEDIEGLGRTEPAKQPIVLQFAFGQSAYLEPLLFPEAFARGKSTLAHEVYVAAHGQYAFGARLFPQAEEIAGGFYSVRGYPESVVAGDSVIVATGEYRLHIPRLFPVQPDPSKTPFLWDKSFRAAPSQTYGRADWDLISRAFVDVAQVMQSERQSFEDHYTLVGTGVGLELQYKQHFNFRVDWGIALTNVPDLVTAGSNRFHISATFLY